jgi:hypothetical protein
MLLYACAIAAAFFVPAISYAIFVFVALMWLMPDSRIEKAFEDELRDNGS